MAAQSVSVQGLLEIKDPHRSRVLPRIRSAVKASPTREDHRFGPTVRVGGTREELASE
jgi:hypothetical protein